LKRVSVQAIDMDWLFEKNKNNAEHLITILANESTSKEIYVKEPIRLFIELMWVKFKPRIIVFVFVPYVVYLSLLYTLTGHLLNSFLINLAEMRFMKEVCVYENELQKDREIIDRFHEPTSFASREAVDTGNP
jgi:hypothetical protein